LSRILSVHAKHQHGTVSAPVKICRRTWQPIQYCVSCLHCLVTHQGGCILVLYRRRIIYSIALSCRLLWFILSAGLDYRLIWRNRMQEHVEQEKRILRDGSAMLSSLTCQYIDNQLLLH